MRSKAWILLGCLLATAAVMVFARGSKEGFRVPEAKARLEAIGSTASLPEPLRRALDPADDFKPIPAPGPSDWLAVHKEKGQTYKDFQKASRNVPSGKRKVIHLQPLGDLSGTGSPSPKLLEEFTGAFFGLEVKVLEKLPLGKDDFSPRVNGFTNRRQILTGDVLKHLRKKLPDDSFCLLAVTLEDLYPDPAWNFVFGQASLKGRTGVYSFVRYDPEFYGETRRKDAEKLILRRSLKVLAHEAGHMFGILHCIHYSCLMNGSNHLQEADSRPLHLCPVCLRKLHESVRFDVVRRYQKLQAFHEKAGLEDEAKWMGHRLEHIAGK